MGQIKDVQVDKQETKNEPSKVGVAVVKYLTYLIIFFGILFFLIYYVIPMF